MNLLEILKNSKCKICNKQCKITFERSFKNRIKTASDVLYKNKMLSKIDFDTGKISYSRKLELDILAWELIIDSTTGKFDLKLNDIVKEKKIEEFNLFMKTRCSVEFPDYLSDKGQSDDKDLWISGDFPGKENNYTVYEREHYNGIYVINLDYKNNVVTDVLKAKEKIENFDFSITKDYAQNKTTVVRKAKTINLSFLLDREIDSLDFDKLITQIELLK